MKKNYSVPELTVCELSVSDVITVSTIMMGNFEVCDTAFDIGAGFDTVIF
jgi:hypothetical protein